MICIRSNKNEIRLVYQTRRAAYECVEVTRKRLEYIEVGSEKAKKINNQKKFFFNVP